VRADSLKDIVLKYVNRPEDSVLSSQTLYECLFFAINREKQCGNKYWFYKATNVARMIIDTQLDNGGFNIGYNFQFGRGLKKSAEREGTTPEILSVTALNEYLNNFRPLIDDGFAAECEAAIEKGLLWLNKYCVENEFGVAVPYAPETTNFIHITNATSFALSALSTTKIGSTDVLDAESRNKLVFGMYEFMNSQLRSDIGMSGKYWPYFYDGGSSEERALGNEKIDNYHIAQQLFFHCVSQRFVPNATNLDIIERVTLYLIQLVESDGFVPYTIHKGAKSNKVDTWGYSSVVMALCASKEFVQHEATDSAINRCIRYLRLYCRSEDHFIPIVNNISKHAHDSNFYPRSDAWVIHAFSEAAEFCSQEDLFFCDQVFAKIENDGFSGKENHTLTFRKKVFASMVYLFRYKK
jgi:hypothetical protein